MSWKYIPRIADQTLDWMLRTSGAVQITGPKWCGKTETGRQRAASTVLLQNPDTSQSLLALADVKPSAILEGPKPRLIDEWQMAPQLWDAVRFDVDMTREKGAYILTGSATPKKRPTHSGVGRIARLRMRTMSLYESGESSGVVSLRKLFDGNLEIESLVEFDIDRTAYVLCRGGWPQAVTEQDSKVALAQAKNYVDEMMDADIENLRVRDATRPGSEPSCAHMRGIYRPKPLFPPSEPICRASHRLWSPFPTMLTRLLVHLSSMTWRRGIRG